MDRKLFTTLPDLCYTLHAIPMLSVFPILGFKTQLPPPTSGSMGQNAKLLTDLPSDALLQIFTECDVLDILNLSSVRGRHCPYPSPSVSEFYRISGL